MKKLLLLTLLMVPLLIFNSCKKNDVSGPEGTFTDSRDGHVYKTIKIGNQTWMAENLAYLPSVNSSNQGSSDEPRYYVYGYQGSDVNEAMVSDNYFKYGVLYNWEAAKTGCPTGWHVPSDLEWQQLEAFLGVSEDELEYTGNRGTVEGDMLKSTTGWAEGGNGNNSSGFTAIPGGIRTYEGGFNVIDEWAEFWSSTGSYDRTTHYWNRYLVYDTQEIGRWGFALAYGLSVRCVKD
jgi:uncharacterized protein (TIGR02145 family)